MFRRIVYTTGGKKISRFIECGINNIENIVEISTRLLLALICSGMLGIERGLKRRPAGFRTYMLVCMGAALVAMTNQFICDIYQTGDPSRMGAQVVSGIGFLGAGTIITTRHNRVTGLTTAAGLWAVACIGLAFGVGYYEGAIIGTFLILFAIAFMHRLDTRIVNAGRHVMIYIEIDKMSSLRLLFNYLNERNIKMIEFETEPVDEIREAGFAAILTLKLPNSKEHAVLIKLLKQLSGVMYVEEI